MKSKDKCEEYQEWKTERQWNEQGYNVKDYSKCVKLWSNNYHNRVYTYYAPNATEPMTSAEIAERKLLKKAEQKEYRRKRKIRLAEEQERLRKMY